MNFVFIFLDHSSCLATCWCVKGTTRWRTQSWCHTFHQSGEENVSRVYPVAGLDHWFPYRLKPDELHMGHDTWYVLCHTQHGDPTSSSVLCQGIISSKRKNKKCDFCNSWKQYGSFLRLRFHKFKYIENYTPETVFGRAMFIGYSKTVPRVSPIHKKGNKLWFILQ